MKKIKRLTKKDLGKRFVIEINAINNKGKIVEVKRLAMLQAIGEIEFDNKTKKPSYTFVDVITGDYYSTTDLKGIKEDIKKDIRKQGELCRNCNHRYLTIWRAPDDLWKKVTSIQDESGLLCPKCFDKLARDKGIDLYWNCNKGKFLLK